MSIYFLINNFQFAFEIIGAVCFLIAAWLTLDSYFIRKDAPQLLRAIGLGFCSIWQVINALSIQSDLVLFVGFALFLLGLFLILLSFLTSKQLQVEAVILIPAFASFSLYFHLVAVALLFAIAYYSFQQSQKEFNKTWIPFSLAFLLISISEIFEIVSKGEVTNILFIAGHIFEIIGFVFLARWVWQYLQLRLRESLVLIFISAALFIGTLVTLAFSTILIARITTETEENLVTDVKVLDLAISGLKEESLAKTKVIAAEKELIDAVRKNDFTSLQNFAESALDKNNIGFITVTDMTGQVLVRAHALSRHSDTLPQERALEEALRGSVFVTIESSPVEKLSIRAGVPLLIDEGGKQIGVVIAGYPLDNAFADKIKRVTGLEMFIYEKDTAVAGTALSQDGRTRLIGVPLSNGAVEQNVLTDGKIVTARMENYNRTFQASFFPLKNGDDKIIGMISAAKPEKDIIDIANSTNRLTLFTVLIIMLILAWPIYTFTKRLTEE